MELLYKPDWEKAKQNYLAWWNGEDFGRCGMDVKAPKTDMKGLEPPKLPDKVEDRWLDFEYLHEYNEYVMKKTFYGGEGLPVWNAGYPGWDSIPAFLGGDVDLMEETGWVHPFLTEGSLTDYDFNRINIKPDNEWWILAGKLHRFAVEDAEGKSLPGMQAISGVGDILAGIRGTENLLVDCMDCPEYVRDFELHIIKIWEAVFTKFYNIIKKGAQGCTNFMHMWAPGTFYVPSCDFAYMVSPDTFRNIFLPSLEEQLKCLDYSLYHVDGEGNFNHIDALLELPKLQCIQVLPGDGKPSVLHYMDILKKVQSAGKNLQIFIKSEEVEDALENLSSRGLFLTILDCSSEEHAGYLLKNAQKWSKAR